ncbi:hypothetical protein G6724_08455 [Polynucleobacter paneuropaeus]|nr:hypothetical protein [Polynucleobacter paneuropaeus]
MIKNPLIFLELNEINFDIVRLYLEDSPDLFTNFRRLLCLKSIRTSSEKNYDELEPWIQWASIHTGKEYKEHLIFRLGDIVGKNETQIFEEVEALGYKVGAISPMNAANRLKTPAYFIPDPWTMTPSDNSFWGRALSNAISQAVNDNARSHLSFKSLFFLFLGFLKFAKVKNYFLYTKLAVTSIKNPWRKALILDLFLHDLHLNLMKKSGPKFSTLFLNAGAHIQHHYFFNASPLKKRLNLKNPGWYVSCRKDPLYELLCLYDGIIGDYLDMPDSEFLLATGLSQKPYDQLKYYYRLNDHGKFLEKIGIKYKKILPRMTRDFLIEFDSNDDAAYAQKVLTSLKVVSDEKIIFGEIDNRGLSLFVTLTYPHEINSELFIGSELTKEEFALYPFVSFVAIKNGMHQEVGFSFFSDGLSAYAPYELAHVKNLHKIIYSYFL